MAAITAQAINELRQRTGLGLMECKGLLKEAGGDLQKAETLAREKGKVKATGRAGRATNAGRVEVALAPDGTAGALVELNCETDFVARNDAFRQMAKDLAEQVLQSGDVDLASQTFQKDPAKTVQDALIDLNARTGENVSLARAVRLATESGRIEAYIHHDGKHGALVQVDGPSDAVQGAEMGQLIRDLALHVVAKRPVAASREDLPAELVAEQRRIFETQVADKPANIRAKIATGKLEAWYGETVLLDQTFVKDESRKVRDVVASAGKDLKVARFALFIVGEVPTAS